MRSGTLGLFYFCKFVELIFLTIWSTLTIGSGTWLMQRIAQMKEITGNDMALLVLIPICILFILGNLFYNNLLINLRFKCKMNCVTIGICVFDIINYIFCYCILRKPCRDKCFTPWTITKWSIKSTLFGITIFLINKRVDLYRANMDNTLVEP